MCKRSFAAYSVPTQRPTVPENTALSTETRRSPETRAAAEARQSDESRSIMDTPIKILVAAGGDLEDIKSKICGLTNDPHPLFSEETICQCVHRNKRYCFMPELRAELEAGDVNWDEIVDLDFAHPLRNFVVRAVMQLATRMITDRDTLPFWDALIRAGEGPENKRDRLFVPPSRFAGPDAESKEEKVLEHLAKAADSLRFHFKKFDEYYDCEGIGSLGYCCVETVPDYLPGFKSDVEFCYGWRDGKPVLQETPFLHMWLDMDRFPEALMSDDNMCETKLTVSELRASIVRFARLICHEFAHAFTKISMPDRDLEPYINTASIAGCGAAWENYVFGGVLGNEDAATDVDVVVDADQKDLWVAPWPNYLVWTFYSFESTLRLSHVGNGALPAVQMHHLRRYRWECFLEQNFWDEPEPRHGLIKKLWLRSDQVVYSDETIGAEEAPLSGTVAKRVCLSEQELECQRVVATQERGNQAMKGEERSIEPLRQQEGEEEA